MKIAPACGRGKGKGGADVQCLTPENSTSPPPPLLPSMSSSRPTPSFRRPGADPAHHAIPGIGLPTAGGSVGGPKGDAEDCVSCDAMKYADVLTGSRGGAQDVAKSSAPRPISLSQVGSSTWTLLHSVAATFPEEGGAEAAAGVSALVHGVSRGFPCSHCASDFRQHLQQHPLETGTRDALEQWMCRAHNEVNVKLGKDPFDCTKVRERWFTVKPPAKR